MAKKRLDWSWRDPIIRSCFHAGLPDWLIAALVDTNRCTVQLRRFNVLGLGRARVPKSRRCGIPVSTARTDVRADVRSTNLDDLIRRRTVNICGGRDARS